jgi:Ca-activated chloride channel family protein
VTFEAPGRLWALLGVAGLLGAFVWLESRRPVVAATFAGHETIGKIAPRRPAWQRALVFSLVLLAVAASIVAWARPIREFEVPKGFGTVMVALDVSQSMEAKDVSPARLKAAQLAATSFVEHAPPRVRIGLVTFSGVARIDVLPTANRRAVTAAIDRAVLNGGTAIGDAIWESLSAIASTRGIHLADGDHARVPRLGAAAVVLLSDGVTNSGRSNDDAIAQAREAHVPVSTISLGKKGTEIGSPEFRTEVSPDPVALRNIAVSTAGRFYRAPDDSALRGAYQDLGTHVVFQGRRHDLTVWFVIAALALAVVAAACSLTWFSRTP